MRSSIAEALISRTLESTKASPAINKLAAAISAVVSPDTLRVTAPEVPPPIRPVPAPTEVISATVSIVPSAAIVILVPAVSAPTTFVVSVTSASNSIPANLSVRAVSTPILATVPEADTANPLVKFKVAASSVTSVPSSWTGNLASALTILVASMVTPDSTKSVPLNKICLLALPNTILPLSRSRKAPCSSPPGAALASGIGSVLLLLKVPAVTSPRSAVKEDRLET